MDIGRKLNQLEQRLTKVERSPRLTHASLENTALQVYDGAGSLRGILGQQADGTTAANIVNGPPPAQPSPPIVASVLGGVTVSWDGRFADGSPLPLDWARVEVHASILAVYDPMPATLQGTIETAQGATVVVPCDAPVYVRLVARTTSGTASTASATVGPYGPTAVVADDILDGIVTETKLAAGAVTEAKIAANAVGTVALQDGAVLAENLADAAVAVGKIADNAVTGPAIATDAVTAGKIQAGAVTATKIQAGAVTAAAISAGAVTTDKLTVTGGANLLTDPSFEGPYTASIVTGLTFASQDTTKGNGSPSSLKIDCTAATATTRQVVVTTFPVLPGDQINLAFDYWVSTDWNGSEVDFQIRWETAAGTLVSFGKATTTSPVRTTWTRLTATVTVPATAAVAKVRAESVGATVGTVWFDNASVRPVLAGTQIQDGVITTQKIAALTIQAGNIAADAIAAGKIAADAVTAREIAALAVTAAEIDANAITAGKIQAGAVDATALAADAITGKTITGGTITGTTITGGTLQTATSGQRITLNEAAANKILVYDSTGRAVAELSPLGLGLIGTNGSKIVLDPSATYPNLLLTNAAQTNQAVINVSETTTGAADIGLNSGKFTGSGFSDMKWRTFFGNDFWVTERIRDSNPATNIGGRIFLGNDHSTVGFLNSTDSTQNTTINFTPGLAYISKCRLQVDAAASSNSVLFATVDSGHTGNLQRLQVGGVDKFLVDKDGSTTVAGNLTVNGIGNRQTKRRTSDATKANTTTAATDSQITFTVDANAAYAIDGFIKYAGANDFLMGWTFPSGSLGEWMGLGNGTAVVSGTNTNGTQQDTTSVWGYTVRTETTDISATRTYGGVGTTTFGIQVRGLLRVGSTGGAFALQWAQGASGATVTTLFTDSYIRIEKVA